MRKFRKSVTNKDELEKNYEKNVNTDNIIESPNVKRRRSRIPSTDDKKNLLTFLQNTNDPEKFLGKFF